MTSQGGDIQPHLYLAKKDQKVFPQAKEQHAHKAPTVRAMVCPGSCEEFSAAGGWGGPGSEAGGGLEPVSERLPHYVKEFSFYPTGRREVLGQ